MALMEKSTSVKRKEASQSGKDPLSKAKEAFRNKVRIDKSCLLACIDVLLGLKVSQAVVQCLNQHYRPDCSRGRIETAEDFKHLARKVQLVLCESDWVDVYPCGIDGECVCW